MADEVVLDVGDGVSAEDLDSIARDHHLRRVEDRRLRVTGRILHRWQIEDGRPVSEVIEALADDPRIAGAQANYTYRQMGGSFAEAEGDPAQYVVGKLHLAEAHRLATGEHVRVAVIDSGIDISHPDLAGVVAQRFDALGGKYEGNPHGTAMAGAIAAHGRLVGVAPSVELLAVRAMNRAGEGTTVSIAAGIDWAVAHGARVINMSFAGPEDPALAQHIAAARRRHVVLVAAAGNEGPNSGPLYPAADPNVIAVTATDADDQVFTRASGGSYVAIAAPGVDVLLPAPHGIVQLMSGTSVAAAHVSGVAALLIEREPSLEPEDVRRILMSTAHELTSAECPDDCGAGLVDAYRATRLSGTMARTRISDGSTSR